MSATSHWFKSRLKDMPRDECFELLRSRQVGRIGFVDGDGPVVLPVNYTVDGESVLVATSPANSLSRHAVGRPVAFEVDEIDEFNETGWSVLVRGLATQVTDQALSDEEQPNPWAGGNRGVILRISSSRTSGRYLLPT